MSSEENLTVISETPQASVLPASGEEKHNQIMSEFIPLDGNVSHLSSEESPPAEGAPVLAPPAELPPVQQMDEKTSRQFRALSQREQGLRQKEIAIRQQEQEIASYKEAAAKAKTSPLEALKALGYSLEEAILMDLEGGQEPTPQKKMEAELEAVKARIKEYDDYSAQMAKRTAEAEMTSLKSGAANAVAQFVDGQGDRFELIKLNNASGEVMELMLRQFEMSKGQVQMSMEEASQLLEEQLETEMKQQLEMVERIRKTKKFGGQVPQSYQGQSIPSDAFKIETIPVSKQFQPTLTNYSTEASVSAEKMLTGEELHKHAARMLKWTED